MLPDATETAHPIRCNVSGSADVKVFFEITQVPVLCNVHWPTQEGALRVTRGDIRLGYSQEVGHIFNTVFEEALIDYVQAYENSLHFSPRFRHYIEELTLDLIERYSLHGKDVVDIGCGKGDFLKLIARTGGNRGVGFDKTYVPDGDETPDVTFIQDSYSERYAAEHKADFITCRHVLEHIGDPVTFVRQIRTWIGDNPNTVVFFEVPNALYTLRDTNIWDIIYEHCSYFTPNSLAYLFSHCGFTIQRVTEVFGGQFLTIEATPSAGALGSWPDTLTSLDEIGELVTAFADNYRHRIEFWRQRLRQMAVAGQKVVIWGSGSKGVTFLNALQTRGGIAYAVDINPRKQGLYVAGTGQQIVPPDFLKHYQPDYVLIMNPIYESEIRETVAGLGVEPEFMPA